ncbi:MAG: response regulator, partial [Planctomycetota bacterium]
MKAPTPPAQNGPALVGSGAVNGSAAPAMIPAVQASAVKAPVSQPPREKITGHPSSSENDRPESIASNALYTPPTGDRGRIFIVDDEPANVNIVRRLLERAGYRQFKSTTDSNVAFKMIQATRPDVVLLDINMPGISGVEVLRSLRGCPETSMLPVLILTANTQPAIKSQCLELGATDFLCKP